MLSSRCLRLHSSTSSSSLADDKAGLDLRAKAAFALDDPGFIQPPGNDIHILVLGGAVEQPRLQRRSCSPQLRYRQRLADRRKSHRRQQHLEFSADDIVFAEVAS